MYIKYRDFHVVKFKITSQHHYMKNACEKVYIILHA